MARQRTKKAKAKEEKPLSEKEALYRAVMTNPDDDLPRLVMADWYQENGEPERAEFIRVQVEQDRAEREGWYADWKAGVLTSQDPIREHGERLVTLRIRSHELFQRPAEKQGHVINGVRWMGTAHRLNTGQHRRPDNTVYMARGFVGEVRVSVTSWMGGVCGQCRDRRERAGRYAYIYRACTNCDDTRWVDGLGPELVKHHPITQVRARYPLPLQAVTATIYVWTQEQRDPVSDGTPFSVPACLPLRWESYQQLGRCAVFTRPGNAYEALNDAMLAWAKQMADDPELFKAQTEDRKRLLLR